MLALPFQERITLSMLEWWIYQLIYSRSCYEEGNGSKYNETLSERHFVVIHKTRLQYHCFLGNHSCLTELERNRKTPPSIRKLSINNPAGVSTFTWLREATRRKYHVPLIYDWSEFSVADYAVEEQFQQKKVKQGWEFVFSEYGSEFRTRAEMDRKGRYPETRECEGQNLQMFHYWGNYKWTLLKNKFHKWSY